MRISVNHCFLGLCLGAGWTLFTTARPTELAEDYDLIMPSDWEGCALNLESPSLSSSWCLMSSQWDTDDSTSLQANDYIIDMTEDGLLSSGIEPDWDGGVRNLVDYVSQSAVGGAFPEAIPAHDGGPPSALVNMRKAQHHMVNKAMRNKQYVLRFYRKHSNTDLEVDFLLNDKLQLATIKDWKTLSTIQVLVLMNPMTNPEKFLTNLRASIEASMYPSGAMYY
ncbi:hypothetical protein BJ085DRAFT_31331 [Dimargaris cristalligena]|uniref:Galactose-binding domain-like protein n=1 Tax=Dimargaris cristalligena TaxID=215637 RepID=A0A4P9ZVR2_9FUNG|nr:hypothetical protein BJ085DRAFT_31331 [Dimargaris cristalligena]|eukprot:RKP37031.1 hypothetical protein BJ085DRAFT_31331 [Dimargaris cristalligena]